MKRTYLDATPEAGKAFYKSAISGEVVMLNLLRFREQADYDKATHLAPPSPLSGREAYQLYMKHTAPFLKEAGSEVVFQGEAGHFLIGPDSEKWDAVLLVRHKSREAFLAFARNEDYLKIAGHRNAALVDSRLLPIEEGEFKI